MAELVDASRRYSPSLATAGVRPSVGSGVFGRTSLLKRVKTGHAGSTPAGATWLRESQPPFVIAEDNGTRKEL